MKFFALGLGLGSIAGAAISYLPNAKNTGKVKDDVKSWVLGTSHDAKTLISSTKNASQSFQDLEENLPKAEKTLRSGEFEVKHFMERTQPNLEAIKLNLKKLSNSVDNLKKL